jgi:hypothetical protein
MRRYSAVFTCFLTALLVVFVAGCGQETVTLPGVISVTPVQGATGVAINTTVTATFSMAMNSASITTSTFTVTGPGGTAVAGAVTYSGTTATFTPTAALAYATTYTATLTTGISSPGGAELIGPYVWSFTTATQVFPALTVVSTVPANTTTGVPVNQVLSATFSEPMNCPAFPATAFTVTGPGTTPVPGTIGCMGTVATFTPAADLATNTVFTATITTAAQDLSGVSLASNYPWTFKTAPAATPPTVISTVPVNGAVNVPINQALSATFNEAMTSASIDTTTFTLKATTSGTAVTGTVNYVTAGSTATFTPTSNLAPTTEYTATITDGAEDLAGTPLAKPYVWTFTTAALPIAVPPTVISTIPADLATGVPLNQIVSATFSEPMNPATINSTTFTLTGPGATAVSGQVVYAAVGNSLTFTPTTNLAASTTFTATITTGAQDLAGTALSGGIACSSNAGNCVWTFTTGAAKAIVSPEIVSTVPANAAINVPLNQAVSATFTEAMDPSTITTDTFTLAGPGGVAVVGTVSYDAVNFIATFTPLLPLTASTTYIATITSGATDLAGNPLGNTGAPNPWSFTTGTAVVTPPVIGPTISLFGGFGGAAGMTNQGTETVVNGDIGTTGASTLITGFYDESLPAIAGVYPCSYTVTPLNMGLVNGSIDTAPPSPAPGPCPSEGNAATDIIAMKALSEAQTAYNNLMNLPPGTILSTTELGNRTLAPGTYTSATFYDITAGNLTLDAGGDPSATWVFQMGTYLTVGTPSSPESVILTGGAKAGNVYWQVGSAATINGAGGGTFKGTIISQAGISVSTAGNATITTIDGRLIALGASTTIVNTVINVP